MVDDGAGAGSRTALERVPVAALTAVGAGLGGLAFFTFVGGAITVAHFRGAGLSGTKAVALVPRSDLLAVGAQVLLLPTVIAAAVLVPFVAFARKPQRRRIVLGFLVLLGLGFGFALVAALWPIKDWSTEEWAAIGALVVIACAGTIAVDEMAKRSEEPTTVHPSTPAQLNPSPAAEAPSRAPAAVLLFLVVALFVAVENYAVAYAHPVLHPMAFLRADGAPGLWGVYVGESDSQVWIGQVVQDSPGSNHGRPAGGRIIEVPRSEISEIGVGPNLSLSKAVSEGPRLLKALEREHVG